MGGAVALLFVLPFLNTSRVRSTYFRPLYAQAFWFLLFDFIFLAWIGQKEVAEPYTYLGIIGTLYYFFFFLVLVPVLGILEEKLIRYDVEKI